MVGANNRAAAPYTAVTGPPLTCRANFLESRSDPKSARSATRRSTALTPPPTPSKSNFQFSICNSFPCPHRLLEVTISELAIPDSAPQSSTVLIFRFLLLLAFAPAAFAARSASAQWIILHGKNGRTAQRVPAETLRKLKEVSKQNVPVNSIAFTPDGGWVMFYEKGGIAAYHIPRKLSDTFADAQKRRNELKWMSFAPNNGWAFLTGDNFYAWDTGQACFNKLTDLQKAGRQLKCVAFTPEGGWLILYEKNGYEALDIPEDAFNELGELAKKNVELKSAAFAPTGGWVVLYNKSGVAMQGLRDDVAGALNDLSKKGVQLKSVSFLNSSFLPLAKDDPQTRDDIVWRMGRAGVPGLGMAVVNRGKIEWARGYGVLRAGEKTAVTEHTLFQADSISKPVTALAALRLVQQGKLDLDNALNDKLVSWKVPENEFTRQVQPTLRQALGHCAGFNLPEIKHRADGPPSLLELLQGTPPANSTPVEVESVPGTKLEYSGGGYAVVQQLLEDVTEKPFPELMEELVLKPVGMRESTFEAPLPQERLTDAAAGHDIDQQPLALRTDIGPATAAAGGLWTTPADLARFVVAVCDARQKKKNAILAPAQVQALLTRAIDDMGLGFNLSGKDQALSFFHRGANDGFVSYVVGFPATGQGAVLMTNSDSGERLIGELLESLRAEYGWPE